MEERSYCDYNVHSMTAVDPDRQRLAKNSQRQGGLKAKEEKLVDAFALWQRVVEGREGLRRGANEARRVPDWRIWAI